MINTHHIDRETLEAELLFAHSLPHNTSFRDDVYYCPLSLEHSLGFEAHWRDGDISKTVKVSTSEVRSAARKALGYAWPDKVTNVCKGRGDMLRVKVRPFWRRSKARTS